MLGELVDKLVGVFSPATAAKRTHARRVYSKLQRDYDAAKVDRTNAHWLPSNRSADLELLSSAGMLRARARDLVRNNAYAYGIKRALVRNIVGCGIIPQAKVENKNGKPNERFNQTAEDLWRRFQMQADVTGRLSFYEIQELAFSEVIEAGEVLIQFVSSPNRSRPLPFALELIECDRLADDYQSFRGINRENGNELRRGVEVNSAGEPVAYWIYPKHPNDINTLHTTPERFPADRFIHLFRPKRIGQTRGVTEFAPVIRWLKDLGYYLENELQSSAVASCFTAAITTLGGPADGGLLDISDTESTDTDGNSFEHIQPGMVARLLPGEDVKVINPMRPNSSAEPWINLMIRSMAVGMGLSYERLARDYSQTNFSSNRASDLEDRREFRPWQNWLITHLCIPVWQRFMTSAVMEDSRGFPGAFEFLADFDRWTKADWQSPGWEWVDPQKEAAASAIALQNNLTTLSDELGKKGLDLRETLEQRKREKEMIDELGLTPEVEEETANGPKKTPKNQAATA
jgi:lambda family phage portal protein